MGIQDTFAINVRKYRKAARITQEKLAELSGLHRTYVGAIEQRRVNVSLKNIGKIADALQVDPVMLFLDANDDILDLAHPTDSSHANKQAIRMQKVVGRSALETDADPCRTASGLSSRDRKGRDTATNDGPRADYALVSWDDGRFIMKPLEVSYEDLTIQILCFLIESGYKGHDLLERYNLVQQEILSFVKGAQA